MASFKPIIRASQQPPDQPQPENSKYRAQAKQLQELFPTWSFDDLHSLLTEVTGDVELAATRISEGHAEQWGSVTRKKDKKAPGSAKEAAHSSTRGGRGGRGGARGGLPGRGGSSARGRGGPPRGAPNGHLGRSASPRVNSPAPPQPAAAAAASHVSEPVPESDVKQNGGEISGNGWAETSSASANAWANAASEPSPPQTNGTAQHHHNVIAPKPTKTPATSKMSWAQIARQQEKPTPPPPAPVVAPAPPPVEKPIPAPVQEPEPVPLREEPTTVQPPTWDDEPPSKPPAVEAVSETWPTEEPQPEPVVEEAQPEPEVVPEPVPEPKEEPAPKPQPPSALPAQLLQQHKDLSLPSLPSTPPAIAAIATPSPKPAQARPSSAAHRASARFKIGEQPAVVMPSSFSAGIEKVGMQFGSLNIGGDNVDAIPTEPSVPEPVAIPAVPEPEPTPAPAASVQAPAEPPALPPPVTPSAPPVPPAHTPTSISSSALFQPTLPRQTPPQPTQPPQLTTSVSQPISSSAQVSTSLPAATSSISVSPAQQYPSQSSVGLHLQQQQQQQHHQNSLPQQLQQQPAPQHHQQHQFSQHSLPSHVDTQPTSHQQQPQQQPQNAVNAAASAAAGHGFFRGAADPFFHTPTPPAPQPQESAYGAFGQLGQQMQHQAQAQASHLGSFGGDYGYGDNQRGFYDSYGQQAGFNGRNTLGHDDMKGGPVSQQPASNVGISATASQTSQHSAASQASVQPQAVAGQAPQQYPPPLPYYYNPYPQNQFYGTPYNSGYGVHNYVKYPAAMFAGGPASGPTPTAKQPGNVQPQSNPYGQGLYTQHQQHPSASYEEIGYQHHNQQPHGLSAGLPSNEYGKQQLYGGQGGFMGLGQSNGPSGGVRNTGGGSPETPYKPYAPKDVGGGVGGGMGVNQGIQGGRAGSVQGQQPSQVGQSQGQGQPQQGQGNFYSNRYAANAGAGVGVGAGVGGPQGQAAHHLHQPQGQGPQSHLAYPQGGSEANFYSYQARQQGYWPQ